MDACLVHTQHRSPINEQWFLDQRTASQLPTPRCQCVRRNSLPGVRTPIDHRCTLACTACWLLTNVDAWSYERALQMASQDDKSVLDPIGASDFQRTVFSLQKKQQTTWAEAGKALSLATSRLPSLQPAALKTLNPLGGRNQVLFRRVDDCIYAFGKKAQGQWTCLGRYVPPRGVNIEFVINAQEGTLSG